MLEDSDPGVPTFIDETGRSIEGRWLDDSSGHGRKIRLTDANPKVWAIVGQSKYKRKLAQEIPANFNLPGMPAWQMIGAR